MNIDDIIENAQLKGRIIALEAEVSSLNAAIRAHERVDCLIVANLKAEVERLESDLKLEKENEDRLVRLWQTANNEVHAQRSQIAALIDNQTRLNETIAEMDKTINASQSEVRRLRKAGTAMGMCLPDTDEANKAYRDFENGGQP